MTLQSAEYWSYIAQMCTPIIAILGFIFVVWQIRIAQNQAKSAHTQVELMQQQFEQDLAARIAANSPFLSLSWKSYSIGPEGIVYEHMSLMNYGSSPAFQVNTEFRWQDGGTSSPSVSFDGILAQQSSDVFNSPKFPVQPPFKFELHVEYRNIFGTYYRQSWIIHDGTCKQLDPPKIVK